MLIGSAVSGGAAVANQALSNRSQSKAFDRQADEERYSLDQQLMIERERAAEERRRYDLEQAAAAEERARRQPFDAMRMAALGGLAKSYGINLPMDQIMAGLTTSRSAAPAQPPAPVPTTGSAAQPRNMGDLGAVLSSRRRPTGKGFNARCAT
jgi:hypothetical protein